MSLENPQVPGWTVGDVLRRKVGAAAPKKMWMGQVPKKCDVCGVSPIGPTFIDGRTRFGPWALMCSGCHRDQGLGLGTGCGQAYQTDTLQKIGG